MSDTGSPADHASGATTPPPDHPPHTDPPPCQDVPAASAPHPASPQILLAAESVGSPRSSGETLIGCSATEQTAQGPAGQSEPPAESQVMECDQPVSLEAEAADENVEKPPEKKEGWGGWSSWGKSLLSSATSTVGQSMTSVKTKAGEALRLHRTSVGEEAQEQLDAEEEEEEEEEEEKEGVDEKGNKDDGDPAEATAAAGSSGKGVFSTITHAVQNTGKSVISGGLDALEFIGKKTMTVFAEGDPGFKRTKLLMQKTISLSQMLKEAKEKGRVRLANQSMSTSTAHYSILFDDYQGLSHLEALEILSSESEVQVQEFLSSLEEEELQVLKKELICIKDIFIKQDEDAQDEDDDDDDDDGDDEDEDKKEEGDGESVNSDASSQLHCLTPLSSDGEEFLSVLTELLFELHVAATPDKLNKARMKAHNWVSKVEEAATTEAVSSETAEQSGGAAPPGEDEKEKREVGEQQEDVVTRGEDEKEGDPNSVQSVYLSSVGSLAEVTARSIEQLHKVAELILHGQELEKPAREQADILSRLTCAMCKEVGCLSKKFSATLVRVGGQRKAEEINPLIDSVLLEGSNSINYIENALQLLLPILQISHIKRHSQSSTEPAAQTQD
ncbi:protein NOXP20 [Nelusetta ayraudi]|uniref:protein NOXP20 n=1 Tax=Nelusetta ayraudi TaxID=303726 RepID=UPI003F70A559